MDCLSSMLTERERVRELRNWISGLPDWRAVMRGIGLLSLSSLRSMMSEESLRGCRRGGVRFRCCVGGRLSKGSGVCSGGNTNSPTGLLGSSVRSIKLCCGGGGGGGAGVDE